MFTDCRECLKLGEECGGCERARKEYEQKKAHENNEPCAVESCQECCQHDDRDHGMCQDCGHEEDLGAAIDRAMDSLEDR